MCQSQEQRFNRFSVSISVSSFTVAVHQHIVRVTQRRKPVCLERQCECSLLSNHQNTQNNKERYLLCSLRLFVRDRSNGCVVQEKDHFCCLSTIHSLHSM